MTEKQLFAEVKNTFKSYDEEGLIDDISLRLWLKNELRRFGNNIMIFSDDIIKISNGKGKLPEDFWQLKYAERYDSYVYKCKEEDKDILQNSFFWKQTIEREKRFVDGKCVEDELVKCVREEVYFNDKRMELFYNNPRPLKLKRNVDSKAITKDCVNLPNRLKHIKCNEITIKGDYLYTDFKDGYVFIKYRAIPMINGEIYIPETKHNRLQIYLEYFLKWKLAEDLWLNNDDPNLANKIQYLAQMAQDNFGLAMTELKFSTLTPDTWTEIMRRNKAKYRAVERLFPNITY